MRISTRLTLVACASLVALLCERGLVGIVPNLLVAMSSRPALADRPS